MCRVGGLWYTVYTMPENEAPAKGKSLLSWEFPEYVHPPRGRGWYLSFAAVVVIVITTSIWSANYTFAFIIAIGAFIYLVRMRRQPPMIPFTIFEDGIQVGGRFYKWEDFREFIILYRPPEIKKLYLEFKSNIRPALDISLEAQNPLRVRSLLSQYLSENIQREDEPLADQWSRFLKL